MPETKAGLSYERAGVKDLNGDKHLVSATSTGQLQVGPAVQGGAPAADDRPPVSVLVKGCVTIRSSVFEYLQR